LIAGIHIGSFQSDNRGIAATVTREDLEALLDNKPIPEHEDQLRSVMFTVTGRDVVTMDATSQLMVKEPGYKFKVFPDNDRIREIGEFRHLYVPSHRRGGRLVHTPMSRFIEPFLPSEKVPAPVSFNDPIITRENLSNMTKDIYGRPSIGLTQLEKIAGPIEFASDNDCEISADLMDAVVSTMIETMSAWDGIDRWKPLTLDEALNGQSDPFLWGNSWKAETGYLSGVSLQAALQRCLQRSDVPRR
jgi:hypothetical protein